ncbi:F-box/kelch-repeat protein [Carex littledalei]|uniref:F-box/kelch-repeat protein n=1 Tax=Carex littledalei TaxID=544730 RepID=A0A833R1V1_9POAL|nr:F-box/kelch-repeat protein [Carex littledalei]
MTVTISEIRLTKEEEGRSTKKRKEEVSATVGAAAAAATEEEKEDHDHGHDKFDGYHDDDEQRPWSELLPDDIVLSIKKKISFLDQRNVKFAFPGWSSVINADPYGPFLLRTWYVDPPQRIRILDPIDRYSYLLMSIGLPDITSICSTKHGWLLLSRQYWRSFFFYNPFSQALIELPPNNEQLFGICFSAVPTSSQCIVLVEEFKKDHVKIIFCCRGDSKWKELYFPLENNHSFSVVNGNAVFYQGKAYRIAKDGKLGVFDPSTESWFVHDNPNAGVSEPQDGINFLVESGNDLFRVWIDERLVTSVCVYKLDHSGHTWKETKSLGGRCFFVSFYPFCIESTEQFRGERDKIYFSGQTILAGSFIHYDLCQERVIHPPGAIAEWTFYGNSCWILPNWDRPSPEEQRWF